MPKHPLFPQAQCPTPTMPTATLIWVRSVVQAHGQSRASAHP